MPMFAVSTEPRQRKDMSRGAGKKLSWCSTPETLSKASLKSSIRATLRFRVSTLMLLAQNYATIQQYTANIEDISVGFLGDARGQSTVPGAGRLLVNSGLYSHNITVVRTLRNTGRDYGAAVDMSCRHAADGRRRFQWAIRYNGPTLSPTAVCPQPYMFSKLGLGKLGRFKVNARAVQILGLLTISTVELLSYLQSEDGQVVGIASL
eukprot:9079207-Pyramimonas_sp.AAC.1